MSQTTIRVPEKIAIFYKRAPEGHVFWSPKLPGLYVWHADQQTAFNMIAPAVSALMSAHLRQKVEYHSSVNFERFLRSLEEEDEDGDVLHPAIIAEITKAQAGCYV